jgi:hypothetical protein
MGRRKKKLKRKESRNEYFLDAGIMSFSFTASFPKILYTYKFIIKIHRALLKYIGL